MVAEICAEIQREKQKVHPAVHFHHITSPRTCVCCIYVCIHSFLFEIINSFFINKNTILSCQLNRLTFKAYKNGVEYSFVPPSKYDEKRVISESNYSQEYMYIDSTIFYLSTFKSTYNIDEIRKIDRYSDWFIAQNSNDTITLAGIDIQGQYWKDVLLESGVVIGYTNVSFESLKEFEDAIASLKKVGRKKIFR